MKIKNLLAATLFFFSNFVLATTSKCSTVFCWWEDWLQAVKDNLPEKIIGSDKLIEVIMGYASFFLPYAWVLAFLALIYAWFLYITSAANEKWAEDAKKILIDVAIWIILILLSWSIVSFLTNVT